MEGKKILRSPRRVLNNPAENVRILMIISDPISLIYLDTRELQQDFFLFTVPICCHGLKNPPSFPAALHYHNIFITKKAGQSQALSTFSHIYFESRGDQLPDPLHFLSLDCGQGRKRNWLITYRAEQSGSYPGRDFEQLIASPE
jgi:hypothetical protein